MLKMLTGNVGLSVLFSRYSKAMWGERAGEYAFPVSILKATTGGRRP